MEEVGDSVYPFPEIRALKLEPLCERPSHGFHGLPGSPLHNARSGGQFVIEKILEDTLELRCRTVVLLIHQRAEQHNIKQCLHIVLKCVLQFVAVGVEHSYGHKTPRAL